MHATSDTSDKPNARDRRRHIRHNLALKGKLFTPADGSETDCDVVDISEGGIALRCAVPLANDSARILYIDGFGRFEAVAVRHTGGICGMRFVCGSRKQERIRETIRSFIEKGPGEPNPSRRHARLAPLSREAQVTRQDGTPLACAVLDVSLQGMSLKTKVHVPVGEILRVGRTHARVVRIHEEGVGLEFVNSEAGGNTLH